MWKLDRDLYVEILNFLNFHIISDPYSKEEPILRTLQSHLFFISKIISRQKGHLILSYLILMIITCNYESMPLDMSHYTFTNK